MSGFSRSPNFIFGNITVTAGHIFLDNNKGYFGENLAGSLINLMKMNSADKAQIGAPTNGVYIRSSVPVDIENAIDINMTGRDIEDGAQVAQNFVKINSALGAGSADLESYGVTSLTDNGPGDWTINFAAKTDATYIGVAGGITIANAPVMFGLGRTQTTTAYRVEIYDSAGAAVDASIINIIIFDAN